MFRQAADDIPVPAWIALFQQHVVPHDDPGAALLEQIVEIHEMVADQVFQDMMTALAAGPDIVRLVASDMEERRFRKRMRK